MDLCIGLENSENELENSRLSCRPGEVGEGGGGGDKNLYSTFIYMSIFSVNYIFFKNCRC